MFFPGLVLALFLAGNDAAQLVAQLGSSRYSEREAAFAELLKLGAEALPALRAATESDDAEVRNRVSNLLEQIEAKLMVEPTLVRLEYRERPLREILLGLGEQAGVNLALLPEGVPELSQRTFTFATENPVPFWEAVHQVCEAASLRVAPNPIQMGGINNNPSRKVTIQLIATDETPAPSSVSGPFRFTVNNIQIHKDRVFNQSGPMLRQGARVGRSAKPGLAVTQFSVGLQIQAEPRISVAQSGQVRLLAAEDEQGRSLAPPQPEGANNPAQAVMNMNYASVAGSLVQFQIPLQIVEPPGEFVRLLKVDVPVLMMMRKQGPFIVDLKDAKGKTFDGKHVTLTIHDITTEPNQNFSLLDLTIRMKREETGNPALGAFGSAEFMAFRHNAGQQNNPVEISDANGLLYQQWFPMNQQPSNEGLRMTLRLVSMEGLGPPAQIRFYDMARTETTLSLVLKDIPMP